MNNRSIFDAVDNVMQNLEYKVTEAKDCLKYENERLVEIMSVPEDERENWRIDGCQRIIEVHKIEQFLFEKLYNDIYMNFQKYVKEIDKNVD